jgi:cytochrome c-type biogenesis protein CcmH/NrfG
MSAALVAFACAALSLVAGAGVLRPLAARSGVESGSPAEGIRVEPRPSGRPRRVIPAAIGALALVVAVGPFAFDSIRSASETSAARSADAGSIAALRRRVAEAPSDVTARLELAFAYRQTGHFGAATRAYLDVLRLDPTNPEAHTQLSLILSGVGSPHLALAEAERALDVRPGDPEAVFARGLALARLHRNAEAIAAFRAYLHGAPFGADRRQAQALLRRLLRSEGSRP